MQFEGADEALTYASKIKNQENKEWICIAQALRHPLVLFYTQYPTDEFIETVEWQNYPAKILSAESFGDFKWDVDMEEDNVYVISSRDASKYKDMGYEVALFEACAVAYK